MRKNIINYFVKLSLRWQAVFMILSRKYDHWILISLDSKNLKEYLSGNEFHIESIMHALRPWNVYELIKIIHESKTEADVEVMKYQFLSKAESNNY